MIHLYSDLSLTWDADAFIQISHEDLHLSISPFLERAKPLEFILPRPSYDQIEGSIRALENIQNLIAEAIREEGTWPEEKPWES